MKKRLLSCARYTVAVVLVMLLWVEAAHALTVKVNNRGNEALYIAFIFTPSNGGRSVKGWWKVDAGGSRSINLGNGYEQHFGKTFAFHATRGKTKWGNGSGGGMPVSSKTFHYDYATGYPEGGNIRTAQFTEVRYKSDTHTLNFN